MSIEIMELLLFVYSVLAFMVSLYLIDTHDKNKMWYGTPKYFLQVSHMNLFGTIISSTIMFLIALPLYICLFIYWLFHVHIKRK